MRAVLTGWPDSGYAAERVRLLVGQKNSPTPPTRVQILEDIEWMATQASSNDLVLFYFAGHGEVVENDVLLLPADARAGRLLQDTSLSLATIKRLLMGPSVRRSVIILDACYTGVPISADRDHRGASEPVSDTFKRAVTNVQRLASDAEGLAILHAGSRQDPAIEVGELGHGLFTHFLLGGLRGKAVPPGGNAINVSHLYHYVLSEFNKWAESHPGEVQRPTWELAAYGDLTLINVPTSKQKPSRRRVQQPPGGILLNDALLAPIRGHDAFIDRENELKKIRDTLTTTTDLAIHVKGEPGIGKTSLIHQVGAMLDQEILPDRQFRHFSIATGGITSVEVFARELRSGIVRCVGSTTPADDQYNLVTYDGFGAELNRLCATAPKTVIVVLMDKFDNILEQCSALEQARIRGLLNYLVVSTNIPIIFLFASSRDLPPMYGSAVPTLPLTLHALTRPESDDMVSGLLKGKLQITSAQLEWIYDLAGGHPFLTRLLLSGLGECLLKPSRDQYASQDTWEQTVKVVLAKGQTNDLFGRIYRSADDEQRYILLWLAANRTDAIPAVQVTQLGASRRTALDILTKRDYLTKQADGSYHLRMRLLREWLVEWPSFQLEAERLGVPQAADNGSDSVLGAPPSQIPRKGAYVDVRTQRVYVDGQETQGVLTDQQYRGLVYLAERVGQVVSSDELAEHLWPEEAHEVDDQRIAQVIHRIRLVLGDRQKPYHYLETLPKRGYRLRDVKCIGRGIIPDRLQGAP
jgi:hypothetical protein